MDIYKLNKQPFEGFPIGTDFSNNFDIDDVVVLKTIDIIMTVEEI